MPAQSSRERAPLRSLSPVFDGPEARGRGCSVQPDRKGVRPSRWAHLCCGLLCLGCDAVTSFQGTVRNVAGEPMAAAQVRVVIANSGRSVKRECDSEGRYRVALTHGLRPGVIRMTVVHEGYRPAEVDLQANRDYKCDAALLQSADMGSGSAIRCRELDLRRGSR